MYPSNQSYPCIEVHIAKWGTTKLQKQEKETNVYGCRDGTGIKTTNKNRMRL